MRGLTSESTGPEQARSGKVWTGPACLPPLGGQRNIHLGRSSDKKAEEELPCNEENCQVT